MDLQVLLDHKDHADLQVAMVVKVLQDPQDQWEIQDQPE